jgi:serine/threonine protein kinase
MTERFTLLTELGRGGMGVVWKARDEETGQTVALKLMREAYAEDADYLARFERELELAQRINSAHVVKVLGFGVRQKMPYLALEFVNGPSLHEALARHGPYSWPDARALLVQLAQGLADAHAAGVIHRDVKPSNVLIGPDGIAKLTDFGIARGLDSTRLTATSAMIGTPAYLAPEGPKDARSDLYSLGIIGFQLLTGVPPFVGQTYQDVLLAHIRDEPELGRLPVESRSVIGWLLAKDASARPHNAWELIPVAEGRLFLTDPVATANARQPRPGAFGPSGPTPPAQALPPLETGMAGLSNMSPWVLISAPEAAGWKLDHGSGHTATLLPGGWVLIAGGETSDAVLASVSLSHVATGSIEQSASMRCPRLGHSAAALSDGRVLICGGKGDSVLKSAEVYDGRVGAFLDTGPMTSRRQIHTATLMPGGLILVAGGWDGRRSLASAEVYEPISGQFHRIGAMSEPRESHTATLLHDGLVLLAGGDGNGHPSGTADIYDPADTSLQRTQMMETARGGHTATLLPSGAVLLAGGESEYESLDSAEIYDPHTGTFRSVSPMRLGRQGHTATLTAHGLVLVVGGANDTGTLVSVELYDPATEAFSDIGRLKTARVDHTATLLPDGRVLVVGGMDGNGRPLASVELLSLEHL